MAKTIQRMRVLQSVRPYVGWLVNIHPKTMISESNTLFGQLADVVSRLAKPRGNGQRYAHWNRACSPDRTRGFRRFGFSGR